MHIPITRLSISKKEESAACAVIRSGWLMQGKEVVRFEQEFAGYVGARYAVAVSSGTAALHLALLALGIGAGDEVIAPSFSFIATANAVMFTGARPVFADIDPLTYNIDPEEIKRHITRKTRAIMPVHQVGMPADMDSIFRISKKYGLEVLEDAACALGSEYKGRKIGSLSKLSCFSFHPRKVISTGEGGMVTTDSRALAAKITSLRQHYAENFLRVGYNYRMTDIQAAIGLTQLAKLPQFISKRRKLALRYTLAFQQSRYLCPPTVPHYATPNFQSYILRINKNSSVSRNEMLRYLHKKGIGAKFGITSIHRQPPYRKLYGRLRLTVTEEATAQTLLLPLFPGLKEKEQEYVIGAVLRFAKTRR